MPNSATAKLPAWARWSSLIWLAIWTPAYWRVWGATNFLHVCDIAVILTCIGLFLSNSLLLSSQAVASILTDLLWDVDAGWRLFTGRALTGGTDYMWDAHYPLWVRLLSLFHIVWPIILICALMHVGYDRRGLRLQSAIAAVALIAARFANPAMNINYAFRNPLTERAWGPAPIHLAVIWIGFVLLIYLPTHLILARLLPARSRRPTNQIQ
ncbi:MAG TPA: hypothetical protein VKS20_04970 [Candidatus Acidoferrales bacterium]|nr:hypothetical protein [Candidatus Acidoferrales bacterium]